MTKRLHLTIDSKVRSTPYMGIQVVSRRYSKLTKIIIITIKKSRARQDYVETLYLETRKTFTIRDILCRIPNKFSIPRNKDCSGNVRPSNYPFITWSMNHHEAAHKIKSFWRKRKRNLSLLDRLAFNKIANMMPWNVMEQRGIHLCFPCQAVDPIISRFIFFALEFQTGEILLVTSWFKYKVTVLLRFLFWKTTDCL